MAERRTVPVRPVGDETGVVETPEAPTRKASMLEAPSYASTQKSVPSACGSTSSASPTSPVKRCVFLLLTAPCCPCPRSMIE
jgi:hypothetical protein